MERKNFVGTAPHPTDFPGILGRKEGPAFVELAMGQFLLNLKGQDEPAKREDLGTATG